VRGGSPTRTATRLVVPIDNPNGALISEHTLTAPAQEVAQTLRGKHDEQPSPS
jgi:hypothetical protein